MLPENIADVKAVFFDLDNTLIDRDNAFAKALPDWLARNVHDLSSDQYSEHIYRIIMEDKSGHEDRYAFCCWLRERYAIYCYTEEEIMQDLSAGILKYIQPDESLLNFLSVLGKQYYLGVISNGSSRIQRAKMLQAGLINVISNDFIYIEGEIRCAKPDLAVFQRVLNDVRMKADRILFIGDHPLNDIAGASNAGMRTCWIRNHQRIAALTVQPDYILNTIQDLYKEVVYV